MERRGGGLVRKSGRLSAVSGQKQYSEEDILLPPPSRCPKWIASMAHQESIILLSPPPAIKILISLKNIELQKQISAAIKQIKQDVKAKEQEMLTEEGQKNAEVNAKEQEQLKKEEARKYAKARALKGGSTEKCITK